IHLSPRSTLFPYTTLFRSRGYYYWSTFAASWINLIDNQSPTSGSFIQNQNAAAQTTANFWIDGTGQIGTYGLLTSVPTTYGSLGDRKSTRLNSSHRTISYA